MLPSNQPLTTPTAIWPRVAMGLPSAENSSHLFGKDPCKRLPSSPISDHLVRRLQPLELGSELQRWRRVIPLEPRAVLCSPTGHLGSPPANEAGGSYFRKVWSGSPFPEYSHSPTITADKVCISGECSGPVYYERLYRDLSQEGDSDPPRSRRPART